MYAVGTSAYDLSENAIDFVDALTREGGSDPAELFHYFSNILVNSAGVIFGVTGIAGGIGGLKDQCFVEGTQVKTEDGNKNIEEIEKGDKVYSSNPETGETDLKEVKQVFVNEADTIVHIKISDEEETAIESIDTTENHPFYVVDYGYKYASELKIGDEIKSLSGDIYSISEVSVDRLKTPIHVYNFEVEDWHTYYVSEAGVLVHNDCLTKPAQGKTQKSSLRKKYMGSTPGKKSKTGKAVIERMQKKGMVRTVRGEMQFRASDNKWYDISDADMAHKIDAVTWWNEEGRFYGSKSKEVREFMLNPDNYYLEHYSINRSQGAKLKEEYLSPD